MAGPPPGHIPRRLYSSCDLGLGGRSGSLEPESMYMSSFMKSPADRTPPPPPGVVAAASATSAAAATTAAEAAPAAAGALHVSSTTPEPNQNDVSLDLGGLDVTTVLKGLCEMFKDKHGRDPTEVRTTLFRSKCARVWCLTTWLLLFVNDRTK